MQKLFAPGNWEAETIVITFGNSVPPAIFARLLKYKVWPHCPPLSPWHPSPLHHIDNLSGALIETVINMTIAIIISPSSATQITRCSGGERNTKSCYQ